jgi:antitoxin component YwqK of YwqJK toxin-antitoxin module
MPKPILMELPMFIDGYLSLGNHNFEKHDSTKLKFRTDKNRNYVKVYYISQHVGFVNLKQAGVVKDYFENGNPYKLEFVKNHKKIVEMKLTFYKHVMQDVTGDIVS